MPRPIVMIAGAGVLLIGATGGFALGDYAIGGPAAEAVTPASLWNPEDPNAPGSGAMAAEAQTPNGPETYVCQGCGPRRGEQSVESYATDYASHFAAAEREFAGGDPAPRVDDRSGLTTPPDIHLPALPSR
ncbi:MAG: hypothetical protein ABW184_12560 [Sphingobium sp.]